jgi:hypothetical protein
MQEYVVASVLFLSLANMTISSMLIACAGTGPVEAESRDEQDLASN